MGRRRQRDGWAEALFDALTLHGPMTAREAGQWTELTRSQVDVAKRHLRHMFGGRLVSTRGPRAEMSLTDDPALALRYLDQEKRTHATGLETARAVAANVQTTVKNRRLSRAIKLLDFVIEELQDS